MLDKVLLSEKVAEDIQRMIVENKIKPKDKIPNEMELASMLNVSRSTIREAIKILLSRNILEIKRGKGTYVCDNPGIATDPLGVAFMDEIHVILYLFETRLIFEPEIAALAAKRASEQNICLLTKVFTKMESDILHNLDHTESDMEFHNIIAKSTNNPILQRIVPIINDGIKVGYLKTKDIPQSGEIVIMHHKRILEAIINRDSDNAKFYMKEHIQNGMNQINQKSQQ